MYHVWGSPSILTPEEMDQLHLEDDSTVEASAGEEDSHGTMENVPLFAATGANDDPQPSGSMTDREEEKRRRNREAAKKGRQKGAKRQADVRQEVLNLQSEQATLKYKVLQELNELKGVLELAETHKQRCNFVYRCHIPELASNIASLPGMSNIIEETRALSSMISAPAVSGLGALEMTNNGTGATNQQNQQQVRQITRKRNSTDVTEANHTNSTADKRVKRQLRKRIDDLNKSKSTEASMMGSVNLGTMGNLQTTPSPGPVVTRFPAPPSKHQTTWNSMTPVYDVAEGPSARISTAVQYNHTTAPLLNNPGNAGESTPLLIESKPFDYLPPRTSDYSQLHVSLAKNPQVNVVQRSAKGIQQAMSNEPSIVAQEESNSLPQMVSDSYFDGPSSSVSTVTTQSLPQTLTTVQSPTSSTNGVNHKTEEIALLRLINCFRFKNEGAMGDKNTSIPRTSAASLHPTVPVVCSQPNQLNHIAQGQLNAPLFTPSSSKLTPIPFQGYSQVISPATPVSAAPLQPAPVYSNIPNWDEIAGNPDPDVTDDKPYPEPVLEPQPTTYSNTSETSTKDAVVNQIKEKLKEDAINYHTPLTVLNTVNESPSTTFDHGFMEPLQFDMTGHAQQDWGSPAISQAQQDWSLPGTSHATQDWIASGTSTSETMFLNIQHGQENHGNDLSELIASGIQVEQNISYG